MSNYYDERPSAASRFPLIGYMVPVLLLLGILALLAWKVWPLSGTGLDPNAKPRPVDARGDLTNEEKTNIAIYERCAPSVVHVTNLAQQRGQFNLNVQQIPRGTGSGFVWDTEGHIVTNFHVVEGADAARVTLSDHTSYDVKRVWAYKDKDIAVLWIGAPKDKLRPIMIGTSHDLKVGQITFAIGNPFGLDQTMTTGIVSALGREIDSSSGRPIHGAIQTSAAINPGNSGGPLMDSAGRLIGMNTAILSPSGASAGIGFAIPVDEINEIVPQLISNGKIVRPRLGVQIAEDQMAQQLGVDKGALIVKVMPNSPAAKAALQGTRRDQSGQILLGDIIVAIDGKAVNAGKDLFATLERDHVGDTITLTVVRDGQRQDFKVTLEAAE
jgi:S1-C subfamily serine protease